MILDKIVAEKEREVVELKQRFARTDLAALRAAYPPLRDFRSALSSAPLAIIAEIKKRSPSAGVLVEDFDPVALARRYRSGGAAALSILTDRTFFGGELAHLLAVRKESDLPILRKDFIIDPLQLDESRVAGADAILLIVRILADEQLALLLAKAKDLGLAALVEVHNPAEARRAMAAGAEIIGINNRDLNTLQVDWQNTLRLLAEVPELLERTVVAESGISHREEAVQLKEAGVSALLIGESLLKSSDIEGKIRELIR